MPTFDPNGKANGKRTEEHCGTCRHSGFPIGRRGFICKHAERAGDVSDLEFFDGCDLWKTRAPQWKEE